MPLTNTTGDHMLTHRGQNVSDLEGGIHSIYEYCNILEQVIAGDTLAPLLRIVDTQGIHGDMINKSFEHLKYVPIQIKNFDTIELDIRDGYGEPVAFESGSLEVTLHFRRAENPYFLYNEAQVLLRCITRSL